METGSLLFPGKDRLVLLCRFMGLMACVPQHARTCYLSHLSDDEILSISSFLPPTKILLARVVCRRWGNLLGDDRLWLPIASRLWPNAQQTHRTTDRWLVNYGHMRRANLLSNPFFQGDKDWTYCGTDSSAPLQPYLAQMRRRPDHAEMRFYVSKDDGVESPGCMIGFGGESRFSKRITHKNFPVGKGKVVTLSGWVKASRPGDASLYMELFGGDHTWSGSTQPRNVCCNKWEQLVATVGPTRSDTFVYVFLFSHFPREVKFDHLYVHSFDATGPATTSFP